MIRRLPPEKRPRKPSPPEAFADAVLSLVANDLPYGPPLKSATLRAVDVRVDLDHCAPARLNMTVSLEARHG